MSVHIELFNLCNNSIKLNVNFLCKFCANGQEYNTWRKGAQSESNEERERPRDAKERERERERRFP